MTQQSKFALPKKVIICLIVVCASFIAIVAITFLKDNDSAANKNVSSIAVATNTDQPVASASILTKENTPNNSADQSFFHEDPDYFQKQDQIFSSYYMKLLKYGRAPEFQQLQPYLNQLASDVHTIYTRDRAQYAACIDDYAHHSPTRYRPDLCEGPWFGINNAYAEGSTVSDILDDLPNTSRRQLSEDTQVGFDHLLKNDFNDYGYVSSLLAKYSADSTMIRKFGVDPASLQVEMERAKVLIASIQTSSDNDDIVLRFLKLSDAELLIHDISWQLCGYRLFMEKSQPGQS